MIIQKEIEVTWIGINTPHFKAKGYTYTKNKDIFIAKVEDLPKSSGLRVLVKCDFCDKEQEIIYQAYNRSLATNRGKYQCHECVVKKDGGNPPKPLKNIGRYKFNYMFRQV